MKDVTTESPTEMMALNKWLRDIGRDEVTGWRWREKGIIKTVNIFGKLYITAEERKRFQTRAEAGEFAQTQVCAGAVAKK